MTPSPNGPAVAVHAVSGLGAHISGEHDGRMMLVKESLFGKIDSGVGLPRGR
jgi:hypothetical protein